MTSTLSHWGSGPRLTRTARAAVLALAALLAGRPAARAGELFTENFNSYAGTQNATQVTTGLPVAFGGTVTGWNRSGDGAIHAVRLTTGNWAPMFYDGGANNIITTASTIAGANTTNATYRVTFQVAPGVYAQASQATTASDAVILSLMNATNSTTLASGTFFPGPFANSASSGALAFQTATFDYQGTGSDSGALNLRFAANNPGAQRFGGTVDNVILQTTARWNNGTSGTWSTGANWLSGAAPVNTDLLVIGGATGGSSTNDLAGLTAAGLEFASTAGPFTISGNALTFSGGNTYYNGVSNLSASAQTLALDLVLGGTTRTFNSVGRLTVNGAISDGVAAAGLTKTGSGTLVLGGTNTYSGTTTISAGAISISSTDALPGWNTAGRFSVAAGASLLVGNGVDAAAVPTLLASGNFATGSFIGFDTAAGDRTVSSTFSGGYGLSSEGGNTLTLSGSNSYSGGTLVGAGTLLLGNAAALGTGTATIAGGVLNLNNLSITNAVVLSSGTLTGGSFDVSKLTPTAGTVAATLTGGTLTKSTAGTVVLSASNSYTGATIVSSGTLVAANASAFGDQSGNLVAQGGVLDLGGYDFTRTGTVQFTGGTVQSGTITNSTVAFDGQSGTVAASLAGSVGLVKTTAGTLRLSAGNSYSGGTQVNAGTLSFANNALGSGNVTVSNATLQWATGNTQDISPRLVLVDSTTATLDTNNNGVTLATSFGGGTSATLVKAGANLLTLSASNSYTGGTRIDDGFVGFVNGGLGPSGPITINAGGLQWATGNTQDISSRLVFVNSSSAQLDTNGNNVTLNTSFGSNASATLIKAGAGTLTLSASNSYTGGTRIDAGTVSFVNGGLGSAGAVTMNGLGAGSTLVWATGNTQDISAGGRLTLVNARNANFNTNGNNVTLATAFALSGGDNGGITKLGTGTLTLTAANAYTGYTGVNAGTLEFANNSLGTTASALITMSGGTLRWATGNTQDISNRLSFANGVTSTFDTNGNDVTFATGIGGATSGILAKSGAGTLTLSGSNNYTGGTQVNAGVLRLGNASALGSTTAAVAVNGGTLDLAGNSFTVGLLTGSSGATITSNTAGAVTLTTASASSGGYAGAITDGSGTVAVVKNGAGTLTLSGSSSYTGGTQISAGVLAVGHVAALGAGTVTLGGGGVQSAVAGTIANEFSITASSGTFDSQSNNNTLSGPIGGTGGLVKNGAGTLTLSGSNTYAGTTAVSAGTLAVAAPSALSGWDQAGRYTIANGATLALNAGFSNGDVATVLSSGTFSDGASIGFDTTAGDRAYGTALANTASGALGFLKTGSGQMTLSASNTYTGNTRVSAGVLTLSGNGKIYSGANNSTAVVTVSSGAVLEFDKWDSGFADWGKGSFGQLFFNANQFVVNGGTLRSTLSNSALAPSANDGRVFTIGALGATLESTAGQTWYVNADSRYGSLASSGGLLTLGGAGNGDMRNVVPGTGGITMAGSGTWTLSAANTYSGDTTVAAGTLVAANVSALGNAAGRIVAQGGVLDLGGRNFTRTGTVSFTGGTVQAGTLTNNTVAFDAQAGTVSAVLAGSAGLAKTTAGTLTLTAASTYAGTTVISGGTLALGPGGSLASGLIQAGNASGDGGTLDVTALGGGLAVASGQKLGGYGTVLGDVTIAGGAIVSPGGSIGTLTNSGTETWGAGGRYLFEITNASGTAPGTDWDLLTVTALSITATSGLGNQFVIDLQSLTSGTDQTAGAMAPENWNAGANYQWKFLEATSTTFSAANFDTSWFNVDSTNFLNDVSGSFSVARGGVGGLGGTTTANELYVVYVAVPEPGTLALAALGLAAIGWSRGRWRTVRRHR